MCKFKNLQEALLEISWNAFSNCSTVWGQLWYHKKRLHMVAPFCAFPLWVKWVAQAWPGHYSVPKGPKGFLGFRLLDLRFPAWERMHGEHGVHLLIHVCFHIRTTFEGEKFSPCQPCLLRQNRRPQRNKNVSEVTDVTKVTFTFASHLHRNIPFNYLVGHVITSQMMFFEAFLHISSILFPSWSLLAPFLLPSCDLLYLRCVFPSCPTLPYRPHVYLTL